MDTTSTTEVDRPLIGICGYAGAGKSTAADYLENKYSYRNSALAYPLKAGVKMLFGLTKEQAYGNLKDEIDPHWKKSPRELMQNVGMQGRSLFSNIVGVKDEAFWIENMMRHYSSKVPTVISDVRFQNEIDRIHLEGGYVIRIDRASAVPEDVEGAHVSEQPGKMTDIDYVVSNNGCPDDLYERLDEIITQVDPFAEIDYFWMAQNQNE